MSVIRFLDDVCGFCARLADSDPTRITRDYNQVLGAMERFGPVEKGSSKAKAAPAKATKRGKAKAAGR